MPRVLLPPSTCIPNKALRKTSLRNHQTAGLQPGNGLVRDEPRKLHRLRVEGERPYFPWFPHG